MTSWPAYLGLGSKELERRAKEAIASLESCEVCPRNCKVNRLEDEAKVCATGRFARVSSCFAHFGEEDCLRGTRGSGTIFFAYCNLKCVFCQNHDTSQEGVGRETRPEAIAGMMLDLQDEGCHNVNFVTPEHVVPQVLEALVLAVEGGLRLPLVYNTSAYDSMESLRWLDGVVDIYMPDFKVWNRKTGARLLKAKNYGEVAREVIREMHRQVGPLVLDEHGVARRGVLLRHLVMPNLLDETREIFRFLATEVSPDTFVNVMGQYRPDHHAMKYEEISRCPTQEEMREARRLFREAGLRRLDERLARRLFFVP